MYFKTKINRTQQHACCLGVDSNHDVSGRDFDHVVNNIS